MVSSKSTFGYPDPDFSLGETLHSTKKVAIHLSIDTPFYPKGHDAKAAYTVQVNPHLI